MVFLITASHKRKWEKILIEKPKSIIKLFYKIKLKNFTHGGH